MIARTRATLIAIGLLLLLAQAACSRTFVIQMSGDLRGPVTFSFYESDGAAERISLNVVEFVVQEKTPDGRWNVIWELRGSHRLKSIEYGAKYDGLEEVISAKQLSRDGRYRALASELSWPSPKGHSAVAFSFQDDGELVVSALGE